MNDAVIVAIISLIGTLGGSFGGILTAGKLTNYRIEQLEKRVEAHNNLVSRMYAVEKHEEVIDEKLEVANHRIADLEGYHK